MDWSLAMEKERKVLQGILALFLSLAVLGDRIQRAPSPLRRLILWILRPAMEIALDLIDDAGSMREAFLREGCGSLAEARRHSRCFRAAARAVKRLIKALGRCRADDDARPLDGDRRLPDIGSLVWLCLAGRDLLARLRSLIPPASAGLLRHASATGPPWPERRGPS